MSAPKRGAVQRFARKFKWLLLCVFIAFGAGTSATLYYRDAIFGLLIAPAGGALSPYDGRPVFIDPTEMLGATIGLAVKGGLVVASPVVVLSVYWLVRPLFDRKRRRFIVIFLPAIFACYMGGTAFAYFVMLPTGMRFLLHFGTNIAVPLITITAYMSIVTAMLFWIGFIFEIPLVMFLLAKLRIVSHAQAKRFRRYVPAAAFILSIIITPTVDAVNQTLVAIPIIALFEVGLFLAWLAEGGHRTLWRRARPKVVWILRRLPLAFVGILLALVAWQLVLAGMDGKLSIEDWHRFVEDWGRFWAGVRW